MKYLLLAATCAMGALQAAAFSWKAKPIADEKTALINHLKGARTVSVPSVPSPAKFAEKISMQTGLEWLQEAIDYGNAVLKATQGRDATDAARRLGLEVIDYPLHVNNYSDTITPEEMKAFNDMVIGYARGARDRVLKQVRAARVPSGQLWIWRIYNMAFLIKGPRHTVAVDLTERPQLVAKPYREILKDFNAEMKKGKTFKDFDFHVGAPRAWEDKDWEAVADLVDLAVITHPHGDHTSVPFVNAMVKRGKPMVMPCSKYCMTELSGVTVFDKDNSEPVDVAGVGIRNFRGFQDNVPCNVYVLDIDGVRVVDNGDNYDRGKEKLLAGVPPADVIIASTWNNVHHVLSCVQQAKGFDAGRAAFIPAHENELGHSVNHRESYHEMYSLDGRLGKLNFPLKRTFPLGWGECLKYRK